MLFFHGMAVRTTGYEAKQLYRDILRAVRPFTWRNEHGEVWRDVLQQSARQEFEQGRHERDALMIARLLVQGRQCLNEIQMKMSQKPTKDAEQANDGGLDGFLDTHLTPKST